MNTCLKSTACFIVIILSGLFLNSCDNSDDVAEIFTGGQWKLTQIYLDDNSFPPRIDNSYWNGNEEAMNRSYELLNQQGRFVITFDGLTTNNVISGNYTGYAAGTAISGEWRANGENREFGTTQESVRDSDVLGVAFINALSTANKYGGDSKNLQIFFTESGRKKYLLFRRDE